MISATFEAFWTSVFPLECQACSRPVSTPENKLCQGCRENLAEHRFSWQNSWHPIRLKNIRCAWSALSYRGPVQSLLQRAKFHHEFYIMETLAQAAFPIWNAVLSEVSYDAVIPMPIDWPGRLNRRYNQTEVLADYLNSQKKFPLEKNILRKIWGRRSQSGLNQAARQWNLFGAFHVKNSRVISGKKILLIDDMITTGATAEEAARLLSKHGALHVDLFTLARSEKQAC